MFKEAIDYLKAYRERRIKALNNEEPQRWFTADTTNMADLINDVFSATDENSEWERQTKDAIDNIATQGVRVKIAVLSGLRHDLRAQFAVGPAHDVKGPADFDRHAISELRFANFRDEVLDHAVTGTENKA